MKKLLIFITAIMITLCACLFGCKTVNGAVKEYCAENNCTYLFMNQTTTTTSTGQKVYYVAMIETAGGDVQMLLLNEKGEIVEIIYLN